MNKDKITNTVFIIFCCFLFLFLFFHTAIITVNAFVLNNFNMELFLFLFIGLFLAIFILTMPFLKIKLYQKIIFGFIFLFLIYFFLQITNKSPLIKEINSAKSCIESGFIWDDAQKVCKTNN